MFDKKLNGLTDADVIKAFELCLKCEDFTGCRECPAIDNAHNTIPKCRLALFKSVLDLINRLQARVEKCEKVEHFADKTIATLQAENSNLQEKNSNLTSDLTSLQNDLTSLKAENERLKETTKNMSAYVKGNNWGLVSFVEFCKNLKAEAYKECIEKVKWLWGNYSGYEFEMKLDNLLKELEGKDKC